MDVPIEVNIGRIEYRSGQILCRCVCSALFTASTRMPARYGPVVRNRARSPSTQARRWHEFDGIRPILEADVCSAVQDHPPLVLVLIVPESLVRSIHLGLITDGVRLCCSPCLLENDLSVIEPDVLSKGRAPHRSFDPLPVTTHGPGVDGPGTGIVSGRARAG